MDECDPDWALYLYLGPTEVKASSSDLGQLERRSRRQQAAELLSNADPSTTPDVKVEEVDDAAQPTDEGLQGQHVDAASLPGVVAPLRAEINCLLEENKSLKETLSQMQMDNTGEQQECSFCSSQRDEINRLLEDNRKLTEKLSKCCMNYKFLENNDKKVNDYTGLPSYELLSAVLTHMLTLLLQKGHKMCPFQMLLLTLMRLTLNLPRQHLAHIFGISMSTVSTVFLNTISALYTKPGAFVNWPERDALVLTMPHQFVEAFGKKVAVIINCFEILIERPSNHKAKAETFSNYKHSNTMKYLIGITPNGAISFISKGWEGRTTDKTVTEQCGIIDKLLPGELVLADHGFDITESVGFVCTEVKTAAFRGKHSQLKARDVEKIKIKTSLYTLGI
ncbi:uncharacterized protein LOC127942764 [Xyrichtys novacula]|uniref:Uncharacterized protein LOC127942764 n=1 Tax=Xyrichtys novacula TaxID=13765 RepID=A0AAV1FKK6_XYRNO|nr:uncharacterized protein LOC127942764 [Xyrichtys novacula]